MENQKLAAMKQPLVEEAAKQKKRAAALRVELEVIEQEAERIELAIAALDGREGKPSTKKPVRRRKHSKPSAKSSDVIGYVTAILKRDEKLSEERLYELVEASLTSKGFSRMGLKLRFKEALASGQFEICADGICLAKDNNFE